MSGVSVPRRLLPVLVMALIYYASSLPGTPNGGGPAAAIPGWLHNLAHVPAYALLALSWFAALGAPRSRRVLLLIGLLTVGYGVLDEWHQSFVPGRECSAHDLLRDALGAGIGVWAAMFLASVKRVAWAAGPAARDR